MTPTPDDPAGLRPSALEPASPEVSVEIVEVVEPDDEFDDDLDDEEETMGGPLAGLFGGGGGGLDMGQLLEGAMQMQQQIAAARDDAAAQVVEGVSGGGVVRVEVTGGMEFRSVHIDPDAVDPSDITLLEDLVLAALRDAVSRANELQAEAMGGFELPGLGGLGGIGGLTGPEGP